MSNLRLTGLVPALALALVLPLAGCSGGGEGPRLLVGEGPPADEWGLIDDEGTGDGGDGENPATTAPQPPRRSDRDGGKRGDDDRDGDDRGDGDDDGEDGEGQADGEGADAGDGEAAERSGTLLVLAAGDAPGTFVVVGHAEDADWGDVAVAADAGAWTLVVEGGASGEYDFGEGLVASPDPGEVRDGDRLRFCDRSSVDGVTASYVQVEDVPGGDVLLRERVQPAC